MNGRGLESLRAIPYESLRGGSVLVFHSDHNGKAVTDFVGVGLNSQERPAQPVNQFDEIFGDPHRARELLRRSRGSS